MSSRWPRLVIAFARNIVKRGGYKLFTVSTRTPCICHPGRRWVLRYCLVFLRVSLQAGAGPDTSNISSLARAAATLLLDETAFPKTIREFSHFNKTLIVMLFACSFSYTLLISLGANVPWEKKLWSDSLKRLF